MCGIAAYHGARTNAAAIVLAGLKRLEYRGDNSWGPAANEEQELAVVRQ
jgi:glucosamine 6-phosphate synthetase-like amidotransferase/phosphosugar isomerase protein